MNARHISQGISALGAIVTCGLIAFTAQGAESGSWPFLIGVLLWALLPYVALYAIAARASKTGIKAWSLAAATAGISAFAIYFYWSGFFLHSDPQSGLLFLILPGYQLVGAFIAWVVGKLTSGTRI